MSHISEESRDLELFHYGVKGMKWGVRRTDAQISAGKAPSARRQRYDDIRSAPQRTFETVAKNGKTVRAIEEPTGKISAFLSSLSKTGVADAANAPSFKIEADGKHVGEASFDKRSKDEINLVWLGVKASERGNGYASAIFDGAVQFGKSEGVKRLTLEVPGNAPDARHIYEKQGFKVVKEPSKSEIKEDTVWGGLTHMELDISKAGMKHSEISEDDELELALSQTFPQLTLDQESLVFGSDNSMEHSEDLELFHFGIKGMKWGVRRKDGPDGTVSSSVEKKSEEPGRYSLKNPKVRRAAIIGTAVTGIAVSAFIATQLSKKNLDPDVIKSGREMAEKILQKPTDIIYVSKSHKGAGTTKDGIEKTGFKFISKGNTKDYFDIFDAAGLNESDPAPFKKMSNGDVAAIFSDLLGRVDSAGREVPHLVLIPAEKANGLNSLEDVITKYGPTMEKQYQSFLESERKLAT